MTLSIWGLMTFLWRQGANVTVFRLLESALLYQNQENLIFRMNPVLENLTLITNFW